jgi:integrase
MRALNFSSNLAVHIEKFIAQKQALGYPYETSSKHLNDFDKMCKERFAAYEGLNAEIAMAWAELRPGEHPNSLIRRISSVRGLALYMNRTGTSAFVIPKGIPSHEIDYVPHIFTREEVAALFAAADGIPHERRGSVKYLVIPCALRLLYATGMRHGEARVLLRKNVDLASRLIVVGPSKNSEGRFVPVCGEIIDVLRAYDKAMNELVPCREWFFCRPDGGCYAKGWLQQAFIALKYISGIEDGSVKRVHDLRHTHCVHRLNAWVRDGKDIRSLLPYLSAYVGHKTLASTDYYLHLVPEFFKDFSSLAYNRNDLLPKVSADDGRI